MSNHAHLDDEIMTDNQIIVINNYEVNTRVCTQTHTHSETNLPLAVIFHLLD